MAFEIPLVWKYILAGIIVLFLALALFYRFYFLRKPKRNLPKGNTIASPADGKIVRILKIDNKKGVKVRKGKLGKVDLLVHDTIKKGYVIVIMMTPFNVHYQRSPLDAEVLKTRHKKGEFCNAVNGAAALKATLRNEKNEILLKHHKIGKFKVVQVAGFAVRRILCFVKAKQKIHKGDELGLVCFGSQVILVIPELKLAVKVGQKVTDGETVIARF